MVRSSTSSKHRGGAPRKAPGGLDRVLFVRASEDLLAKLERAREARSKTAGVVISIADITRALLEDALTREEKRK